MQIREVSIVITAISLLLFFLILALLFAKPNKKINLDGMVNGNIAITSNNMKNKIQDNVYKNSYIQNKKEEIQQLLKSTFNTTDSPESVIKFEFTVLLAGLGLTFLVHIVFHFFIITILCLCLTIYFSQLKYSTLKSKNKQKLEQFDEMLPQFETNILMALQAGANLPNAMEIAIKNMENSLEKREFEMLLIEINSSTSDGALPYMNLAKRVPTKDCERFSNVVSFGLKNGNSMSEILENESEYMSQKQLNKIREKGEKNATQATAISSGLVFLPMIVLFIAPLMMQSM